MLNDKTDRRTFLQQSLAAGAAAGVTLSGLTAASYGRTLGANDRINVGLIGCGGRNHYLANHGVKAANVNATVVAACEIVKPRLQWFTAESEKIFGLKPQATSDYRKLLDNPDIDAVIIATPDHQHCGQTIHAVQAGKHVYVEKPILGLACDLPELNQLYDVVKNARVAVQHGTQGASSAGAREIRKVIAEGTLGKLFRVQSTETLHAPYWTYYQSVQSESDTDWKAFLYNRPDRPFDGHMHGKWMGYKELTSGTIGGWMSHFINLVHYVTGCNAPVSCTAWGGRYATTADPRCTAPDQTMVMLDYAEGFHTQFTSHFGSAIDNETTTFMFEKGSIRCAFGHDPGNPLLSSEGVNDEIPARKLIEGDIPPTLTMHVKNWLECIRSGRTPSADMELGYKHGVAVAMGDLAWDKNCKVYFDPRKRELHT